MQQVNRMMITILSLMPFLNFKAYQELSWLIAEIEYFSQLLSI